MEGSPDDWNRSSSSYLAASPQLNSVGDAASREKEDRRMGQQNVKRQIFFFFLSLSGLSKKTKTSLRKVKGAKKKQDKKKTQEITTTN